MGSEGILFVDDEKMLIGLGRDLLERLDYRVETRASSLDAFEDFRIDSQKYGMVISDMTMPRRGLVMKWPCKSKRSALMCR